jgi:hypothetical protein
MKGTFRGIAFESGYEKKFLEQCYMLGIRVVRSPASVAYQDSTGKWHSYKPDFLWPDHSYTVEVKGTWAFRDNHGNVKEKYVAAVKHFQGRYTIVTERELKSGFVAKLYASLVRGAQDGN